MKKYKSDYLEPYEAKMPDKEKYERLRNIPLFGLFKQDEELEKLVKSGCWYKCPAGTFIIREGDNGSEIFVIISGKVRVFKGNRTLAVLLPGEIVGEMGALVNEDRCANVMATEECTLFRLDINSVKDFHREQLFNLMLFLYRVTAKRLVDADRRLAVV